MPPILFSLRWVYRDSIDELKGGDGSILSELRYLIAHRHANQDVIGLAFLALEQEQSIK
ncbi:MAG: hypothetical protein QNL04_15920 [SAR324 cluster bacterium]|nr:hypothetical protein [SAR324 cluster bacterium]